MGYFRRKIDRARGRELIRRLEREFATDPRGSVEWEVVPPEPPRRRCYLRFACRDLDPDSGRRRGVFQASYGLLNGDTLDPVSRDLLAGVVRWFEQNLPVPWGFSDARAIFLFKSTAPDCVGQIWELVRLLREHGIDCAMQRVHDPGVIVFEDAYQVAVVPSGQRREL